MVAYLSRNCLIIESTEESDTLSGVSQIKSPRTRILNVEFKSVTKTLKLFNILIP